MYEGYKTIFSGVFLATFHINIGPIQLLPSFIGWFMVAGGANTINNECPSANTAKAVLFGKIAACISLISGIYSVFFKSGEYNSMLPAIIFTLSFGVMELLMEYKILEGAIEYFIYNNDTGDSEVYILKLRNYTVTFLINLIMQCIAITFLFEQFAIITAILAVILRIWYMSIINSIKKRYSKEDGVNSPEI